MEVIMRLIKVIVAVLSSFVLVSVSSNFQISPCQNSTETTVSLRFLQYSHLSNVTSTNQLICPWSTSKDSPMASYQWNFTVPADSNFFSNDTNYPADQVCISRNRTLFFVLQSLTGTGQVSFTYTSFDGSLSGTLTSLYASQGTIVPLNDSNIEMLENESINIEFLIYRQSLPEWRLYRMFSNGTKSVILDAKSNLEAGPFLFRFPSQEDNPCISSSDSLDFSRPLFVRIEVIQPQHTFSDVYLLADNVLSSNTVEESFTLTIQRVITPSISMFPSPTSSIISESSSIISSISSDTETILPSTTTPSATSSTTPTSGPMVIIIAAVIVLVAILVAIVVGIIICIGVYRYHKKKHIQVGSEVELVDGGRKAKPSPSLGATATTIGTPTTSTNYTAVYCSEKYEICGTMWVERLKDQIKLLSSATEIFEALGNDYCVEILVFMDPTDDVAKELLSRGCPYNREKLKWWQFVAEDKTPHHMIEIEGYHIVQVEGDPADFNTHQLGLLKTNYPTLTREHIRIQEHHHTSCDRDEVDTDVPHKPEPHNKPIIVELLSNINDTLKQHLEVTKETRDINRETRDINRENLDTNKDNLTINSERLALEEVNHHILHDNQSAPPSPP